MAEETVSVHIAVDELADADAGLLDDQRNAEIDAHLRQCAQCTDTRAALADVSRRLAAEPAPPMPDDVAQRLAEVLAGEGRRRAEGAGPVLPPATDPYPKPSLGTFGAEFPHQSRSRFLLTVVAAALAAAVVGFAGYVVSASAGMNEPVASAPVVVNSHDLGSAAHSILQATDPGPHRFSKAWRCARDVTTGRITGLASVVVDGEPALLVYTRTDDVERVTVVTGCESGTPSAGPATVVPR